MSWTAASTPPIRSRDDIPGCGEPNTSYRDVAQFVAFYCTLGDFMVYDDGDDSLLGALAENFGPSIMGVVLAHEFGHAIQFRSGDLDSGVSTILTEQQADCFAGAWVSWASSGAVTDDPADRRRHPRRPDRDGHGPRPGRHHPGRRGCARLGVRPDRRLPGRFQRGRATVLGTAPRIRCRCSRTRSTTKTTSSTTATCPTDSSDGSIIPLVVTALNLYWTFDAGGAGIDFPELTLVPVSSTDEVACPDLTPGQVEQHRVRVSVDERGVLRRTLRRAAVRRPDRRSRRLRRRLPARHGMGRGGPGPARQPAHRRAASACQRLPGRAHGQPTCSPVATCARRRAIPAG